MTGVAVALLLTASAFGWGAILLRLTGQRGWAFALPLGVGAIGWLVFPFCLLLGVDQPALLAATLPGLAGLALLPRPTLPPLGELRPVTWALLAALVLLALGDLAEALAPPADADSLAYHFALPAQFLRQHRIFFTPRAVDGAVPLSLHMTYLAALGLGGERTLTLWCGISGWALVLAAYGFARRHLERDWALAAAVLLQGLPAVLYGGGSGQVETRLAALAIIALAASARARAQGDCRLAVLAGIAAGFVAAGKYPGLLVVGVAGLPLLFCRARLRLALAYGLAAVVAGGQWYLWHWLHSGDPLFPMLYGLLPYRPGLGWDDGMAASLHTFIDSERPFPHTLLNLFLYPFKATFAGLPVFESDRTGLGPLPVLLLPFAWAAFARDPARALRSSLFAVMAACAIGYALWFVFGPSQRVRHLVPLAAPALVVLLVGARRCTVRSPATTAPLVAGLAAALALELAGQAVFSAKYVRMQLSGQSRDDFLAEQVANYPVARWLNAHLAGPDAKILINMREINYLVMADTYLLQDNFDGRVRLPLADRDPRAFFAQLRAQGITHLAVDAGPRNRWPAGQMLIDHGCARLLADVPAPPRYDSRTLRLAAAAQEHNWILQLQPQGCPLGG